MKRKHFAWDYFPKSKLFDDFKFVIVFHPFWTVRVNGAFHCFFIKLHLVFIVDQYDRVSSLKNKEKSSILERYVNSNRPFQLPSSIAWKIYKNLLIFCLYSFTHIMFHEIFIFSSLKNIPKLILVKRTLERCFSYSSTRHHIWPI
jgi:hypothetical protein